MFWALNGATRNPSCKRMRHRAAVSTDLPALEQVPWNMMAGVLGVGMDSYSPFFSEDDQVADLAGKGQGQFDDLLQPVGAVRLLSPPGIDLLFGPGAFHADDLAARRVDRGGVQEKFTDVGEGAAGDEGHGKGCAIHLGGAFFQTAAEHLDILQAQGSDHMAQKRNPFLAGLHQDDRQLRSGRLEGQAGKSRAGTDVEERLLCAARRRENPEQGQGVEEVGLPDLAQRAPWPPD